LGVLDQFPRTGAGHPDSRLRASPRILEPGQISRSRYRHAESNLRASPCNLEIERQNTDSKFRDSSFCLRSCTFPSSCRVDLLALALALIHALTRRLAELNRRRNTYRHIGDNGTCSWGKIEGRWSPATSDEKRIDHSGAKQRKRNRSRNRSVRACAERHVLRERQPVRRRHDAGTRRPTRTENARSGKCP
jgi:hypothetical protein